MSRGVSQGWSEESISLSSSCSSHFWEALNYWCEVFAYVKGKLAMATLHWPSLQGTGAKYRPYNRGGLIEGPTNTLGSLQWESRCLFNRSCLVGELEFFLPLAWEVRPFENSCSVNAICTKLSTKLRFFLQVYWNHISHVLGCQMGIPFTTLAFWIAREVRRNQALNLGCSSNALITEIESWLQEWQLRRLMAGLNL